MPEALEDVFQAGRYVYMEDLKIIASRKPKKCPGRPLPTASYSYPAASIKLATIPAGSSWFRICYILVGRYIEWFQDRLQVYGSHQCSAAKCNMQSAIQNPQVVNQYLTKECEKGRIIGPLEKGSLSLHINRFGVIPKPHQPGKWGLIMDMSYPDKASVNGGYWP